MIIAFTFLINLLKLHQKFHNERVAREHIIANSKYISNADHRAKNNEQMYYCTKNTLTPEAKRKIMA